jgi:phenylpropionate dioxygenase-like ring-hydroxylating dioxygenase large terminal subunit
MPATALRHYWYPVVPTEELGDKPLGVRVLGEELVLYRAGSQLVALRDLCIHRGTPLSRGGVDGEMIVCAYHGWAFAPDGACVRIPSLDPSQPIPRKARVAAYRTQQRYRLVWVCLDEPRAPLPEFPELDDESLHTFGLYRGAADQGAVWQTSAARMLENFMDSSHFPFVHPGIFGRPDMPRIPSFPVERRGDELSWELDVPVPDGDLMWGLARHRYRLVFPFNVQLARVMPDGKRLVVTLFVTPITAKQIRRHVFVSRDFALDIPDPDFRTRVWTATEQDRAVVESQRPEELPIDLTEELHVKGPDTPSVEYRRMLAEIGLTRPGSVPSP